MKLSNTHAGLIAMLLGICVSCVAIVPEPEEPPTDAASVPPPEFVGFCDLWASAGSQWTCQVEAVHVDGLPIAYTAPVFPAGMTVSADGSLEWTPAEGDGGLHPVEVVASVEGAEARWSIELQVEETVLLATWELYAGQEVSEDVVGDDGLAQAALFLPAEAVLSDGTATLTRWRGANNLPADAITLGLTIDPPPAVEGGRLVLEYDDAYLDSVGITSPDGISALVLDPTTGRWDPASAQHDETGRSVDIPIAAEQGGRGGGAGAPLFSVGSAAVANMYQPSDLCMVWCDGAQNCAGDSLTCPGRAVVDCASQPSFSGSTGVVLHGLFSTATEFVGQYDLLTWACDAYDSVAAFNYPSGSTVEYAAWKLRSLVGGEADGSIDLIGHSMGGLVARRLVEWPFQTAAVDQVGQVGSPNTGATLEAFFSSLSLSGPWLMALFPSVAQVSAGLGAADLEQVFGIGGDIGSGGDGIVSLESAQAAAAAGQVGAAIGDPCSGSSFSDIECSLSHSGLHVQATGPGGGNGVGAFLTENLISEAGDDDDSGADSGGDDDDSSTGIGGAIEAAGITLLPVESGTFEMGCTAGQSDCEGNESPAHMVTLTRSYWLAETEVTQSQWEAVIGNNPSYFGPSGGGVACGSDCPVELVNWFDALAFANAVSTAEGLPECYVLGECSGEPGSGCGSSAGCASGSNYFTCASANLVTTACGSVYECEGYRLPTEAEWEYAARAGTDLLYSGSDIADEVAWYGGDFDSATTHPTATKLPNQWGFYDMSGNVWEWVWDTYANYNTNDALTDPLGPIEGQLLLRRGGAIVHSSDELRVSNRYQTEGGRTYGQGFRLARTMPSVGDDGPAGEPTTLVYGLSTPSAIPHLGTITGSSEVVPPGLIDDVVVMVDIDHPWISDLEVRLTSPTGTDVLLFGNRGGSGDDLEGTFFDDSAGVPISSGSPPFSGEYVPEESLSVLVGEDAGGSWTLTVTDSVTGDSGVLWCWQVLIWTS